MELAGMENSSTGPSSSYISMLLILLMSPLLTKVK
jgi:hypothetical protein